MKFKTIQGNKEQIDIQLNELANNNHVKIVGSNSVVEPYVNSYGENTTKIVNILNLYLIPKTKQIPDESA